MTLHIFLLSLAAAASTAVAGAIPSQDVHVVQRRSPLEIMPIHEMMSRNLLVPIHKRSDILDKRANQPRTLDLSWQKQETPLFTAEWAYTTPRIPIGPLPANVQVGASSSLTLQCADCRTYGNITISLSDDDVLDRRALGASMVFNGVGAYLDLAMFVSGQGTYTIGMGYSASTGNATGKFFSAAFGANIDLILQVTGEVKLTGGFQVSIPDGEKIGMAMTFGKKVGRLIADMDADLDLVPQADFYLLPLKVSQASVNVTAALRIKVEASTSAEIDLPGDELDRSIALRAGAHLTIARVQLGASFHAAPATCRLALHADVETEAGAFLRVEGQLLGDPFARGPDVSKTFFHAGTTRCMIDGAAATPAPTPEFIATKPAPQPVAQAIADGRCPEAVTGTTTVSSVYSLTTCAVPELNCPLRFAQTIVVTNSEVVTTTTCPNVTGTAYAKVEVVVTPVPVPTGADKLVFSGIPAANRTAVGPARSYANITVDPAELLQQGRFVSATPPPPPPPPAPTGESLVGADQKPAGAGSALGAPVFGGALCGMISVGMVMLLL